MAKSMSLAELLESNVKTVRRSGNCRHCLIQSTYWASWSSRFSLNVSSSIWHTSSSVFSDITRTVLKIPMNYPTTDFWISLKNERRKNGIISLAERRISAWRLRKRNVVGMQTSDTAVANLPNGFVYLYYSIRFVFLAIS